MSQLHQVDPGKMIFSVGTLGVPVTGYAKGTFLEFSRDVDAFVKSVGSDGEVTRVRNRNRAGSVKVTLQQGSQTNAAFSALAILDEQSGLGVVPCTFMDMSGLPGQETVAASTTGWIRKMPDTTMSGEGEEHRVWIFDLAVMPMFVGGN